jgi:hypothetical protein
MRSYRFLGPTWNCSAGLRTSTSCNFLIYSPEYASWLDRSLLPTTADLDGTIIQIYFPKPPAARIGSGHRFISLIAERVLEMRYISTTAVAVEKLKQQAKKSKAKLKIPHSEALDRVARGAGYNHWNHVTWCAKATERLAGGPTLQKECEYIIDAAMKGRGTLVITGPEILKKGPLILFSTDDGDAWLLDPEDELVMNLAWHGARQEFEINDTGRQYRIGWHGEYRLNGPMFQVDTMLENIGQRAIGGYPMDEIRESVQKAESIAVKMNDLFLDHQGQKLTDELIEQLVGEGWRRDDLLAGRDAGAVYSAKRGTLLYPMMSSEDEV